MHAFLKLLTVLAILMPPGGGGIADPVAPEPHPILPIGLSPRVNDLIQLPESLPVSRNPFLDCLAETALDEEDSVRVEDRGMVPSAFPKVDSLSANHRFHPSPSANPHSRIFIANSILRC